MTDSRDPVGEGHDLTYAITIANNGPFAATEVALTDTLPVGVTFISATSEQDNCQEGNGVVTCELGFLASNDSTNVEIVVIANTEGTIINTANVMGSQPDPVPENNRVTEETTVVVPTPDTFTVNSIDDVDDGTCDLGHCSLREAITAANSHPGKDIIAFDIAGQGPHTIEPTAFLPTIIDSVIIDGTTEPDFAGVPVIELNGSNAGFNISGFRIVVGNCTIRGLAINRFTLYGIGIETNGSNIIEGNYIGTDLTGTVGLGNRWDGININGAPNNKIGGKTPETRNVISGNGNTGVFIQGASASGNFIQGNYIGTDVTGTSCLSNEQSGVWISNAPNNIVGGNMAGTGNVISGSRGNGVTIAGNEAERNLVQGNYIGTDATGTAMLPNEFGFGVIISFAPDNTIGGTTTTTRNIIAGQHTGVVISGGADNLVLGNLIGTDVTGTLDLGNKNEGIRIDNASDNTIGGIFAEAGNTIAYNGRNGIRVTAGSGNRILSNSIFNNADLGIDLGFDGVTPNDSADVDTGPNNLQNFPEIASVEINENEDLVIEYSVDSDPSHSAYPLTIQFFESDSSGQGKTLIGEDLYNATDFNNGAKKVNMGNAVELEVLGGDNIVATATDTSGNTSEFSPIKTVVIITSVAESEENVPKTFVLHQNYPNPFNPETTIQYQLPKTTQVKLVIYNLEGQQVATLVEKQQPAGLYSIQWDGKAASGKKVASGVYLYRLETTQFVQVRKLVLVR